MDDSNKTEKKDLWEALGKRIGVVSATILLFGVIVNYSYTFGKDAAEREYYKELHVLTTKNQQLNDKYLKLQSDLNTVSKSLEENQDSFNARLEAKFSELDKAIRENNESKKKSEEIITTNSSVDKKEKAEALILESMQNYANLGVDMDHWDNCDKEYTEKYRKGKVLLDQIYSLNKKYKISDEYSWFVTKQYGMMIPVDRKCKT